MDDFRLKVFVFAARHLNFTKCAKEMGISQPAVSGHISHLEEALNISLFDRKGTSLALTDAGRLLLMHAEIILDDYQSLNLQMGIMAQNLSGHLSIGVSNTISNYLVPPILGQFISSFPKVRLSVESGKSAYIEQRLLEHKVDLGFIEKRGENDALRYDCIYSDRFVLVADTCRSFSRFHNVSIEELIKWPIVMPEDGSDDMDFIENILRKEGVPIDSFNVVMQLGSIDAVRLFLRNTDACAIVPFISVKGLIEARILGVIAIEGIDFIRDFYSVSPLSESNILSDSLKNYVFSSLIG